MGEDRGIPSGWEIVRLGDVCSFEYGKALKAAIRNKEGNYPVLGSNGCVGFHDTYLVNGPGVVIGRKGAAGEISFVGKNFWPIDTTYFLKLNKDLSLLYFYFLLGNLRLNQFEKSTAIPGLNRNDAYDQIIPIPPLPEQHRIVGKIEELFSSLDKGIESLKTVQQQLKVYRQAVLKWAFEGKLTNKNVVDGELPVGWEKVKFGKVFSESPQNGLYKSSTNYGSGTRIVRIDGFYEGKLLFDYEYKKVRLTQDEINRYRISVGDILINRVNSLSHLGKCGFVEQLKEETVFESNIMKIIVERSIADAKYISIYLSSIKGLIELRKNAKHAVNQASINQKDVSNVLVPLAPLWEQQVIVAEIESRLSVCDKIGESIEHSLKKAESLRQSILKKAFEGKLVPQDPKDEQASVLLARIKAEREKNKPEAPRVRRAGKTRMKKAHS